MSEPTSEQKRKLIESYGFTVGERDPRFNTDHPGAFMVVEGSIAEIEQDYELPFADGSNGPWCLVGDDLDPLVGEAFDLAMGMFYRADEALADILAGGSGVLSEVRA